MKIKNDKNTIRRLTALPYIICFVLLFFASCGNRNPNLSEKQLLALLNDTTSNIMETPADILPDTGYIPPVGAKYVENRSIEPASPPVTLKVSISEGTKQTLKLSMFGSEIEYVTLRLPNEDDYFLSQTSVQLSGNNWAMSRNSSTEVKIAGNFFITSDWLGVRLFNKNGVFVKNLLLSEFEGNRTAQKIEVNYDGLKHAILRRVLDDRCFLAMCDYASKETFLGEYCFDNPSTNDIVMTKVHNYPLVSFLDNNTMFGFNDVTDDRPVAISFNLMGDTLCKFTNYVRFEKKLKAYASSDRSLFYRFEGKLFFRQSYCDTIFRVDSENRITPVYLFDFGDKRATVEEGLTAKTEGKLLLWKWIAFKNSMILIFTEGRDCQDCRREEKVTFHCLMFDKNNGRSIPIDMKSYYPENILIENDIDGRFPIPFNSLNVDGSVILATITKIQIDDIIKYSENIPLETVSKLKIQAEALKQNEILLMIIKN